MTVHLLGYSERGIVNALCEDISHSPDPHAMLANFLSWFDFLEGNPDFSGEDILEATLLVEQGFSDFGDLDLLVLVKLRPDRKLCFLIEAKVSNDTNSWQTVGDRWSEFADQLAGRTDNTSNLFVQLHRKVRLVAKLRDEHAFTTDCLVPRGKLGQNQIVDKACNRLKDYLSEDGAAWFGAILPDAQDRLNEFARDHLLASHFGDLLPTWNTQRWGLLSWHLVAQEVVKGKWPRTEATFEWNQGQIFRTGPSVVVTITRNSAALHDGRHVYVVECRKKNCRVIHLDEPDTGYFWRTAKVSIAEISPAEDNSIAGNLPSLPQPGRSYVWDSRNEPTVPTDEPQGGLQDGSIVTVTNANWVTTRVRLASGPANTFLVYTHQLRRH